MLMEKRESEAALILLQEENGGKDIGSHGHDRIILHVRMILHVRYWFICHSLFSLSHLFSFIFHLLLFILMFIL